MNTNCRWLPKRCRCSGEGDDRYAAVDKMLLKGVDALPHGLINNVPDNTGYKGSSKSTSAG